MSNRAVRKNERRNVARRVTNGAGWRADGMREFELALHSLAFSFRELNPIDRKAITSATKLTAAQVLGRWKLLRSAAHKLEIKLRKEARKANAGKAAIVLIQCGSLLTLMVDYLNIIDLGIV